MIFGILGVVTAFGLKMPASLSKVVSVDGAMPTPSCVPKGKAGERGGRAYLGLIRVCVGNGGNTGGLVPS